MSTTNLSAIATLILLSWSSVQAEVPPAWMAEDFVMEEIVVTAEAPATFYMEEIVVTAQAPAHLYMEEIVVTATLPDAEAMVASIEPPELLEPEATTAPFMEEVVVTATMDEVRAQVTARVVRIVATRLARLRALQNGRLF